jgi:Sec-independent protein translocase protein TatA
MNRIVAIAAVLTLSAIMFMGCDDKVKQNGEAMTAATKEFVKSALNNAADSAKQKASEAADVAKEKASDAAVKVKETAKEKVAEAAESVAEGLRK